jgi:hypothetical protein
MFRPKGVYCMGIKLYNKLPPYIKKECYNPREFKTTIIYCIFSMHIIFIL